MEVNILENEQWKDIPGYEGIYQASTLGRIRTCEGKATSNARYSTRIWKQRIIKQKYQARNHKSNRKRDARVCLWKDGKGKTFLVSRLIAITWCDGYSEGLTVNHIDGNPENNNASNLEWVTLRRNVQKGFEDGLFPQYSCVIIESNGDEKHFRSYAEAGRYIGKNAGFISYALNVRNKAPYYGDKLILPF